MRKTRKFFNDLLKSRHVLIVLVIICITLILATFTRENSQGPLYTIAGTVITPFQNGVNRVGNSLLDWSSGFKNVQKLNAENEELRAKIDELTAQNTQLIQAQAELKRLEDLYELDQEYPEYTKVAASVISKDPGNWYSTFVINKGTADGLAVDMNVLAGSGLIGIITETGENWSTVRTIIDDTSSISGMIASTSDTCVVSGNLSMMDSGKIEFSELKDRDEVVTEGTAIVTSNISTKFLTGLLIGYVAEIEEDSNHLTKSGTLIPAADFKNIREVLVIKELKQTKEMSN